MSSCTSIDGEVIMTPSFLSRREVLRRIGGGFGALGLASLFTDAGKGSKLDLGDFSLTYGRNAVAKRR